MSGPAVPESLGPLGAAKWTELVSRLTAHDPVTLTTLEVYCASYQRWREAQIWLDEHGDVLEVWRGSLPWFADSCRLLLLSMAYLSHFILPQVRTEKVRSPESGSSGLPLECLPQQIHVVQD